MWEWVEGRSGLQSYRIQTYFLRREGLLGVGDQSIHTSTVILLVQMSGDCDLGQLVSSSYHRW